MIDKHLQEKITAKAYSIWEWRQANNVAGSDKSDWDEAKNEICPDRRITDGCPVHGPNLKMRYNDEIVCLRNGCDFKTPARRKQDEDVPSLAEIKKVWQ